MEGILKGAAGVPGFLGSRKILLGIKFERLEYLPDVKAGVPNKKGREKNEKAGIPKEKGGKKNEKAGVPNLLAELLFCLAGFLNGLGDVLFKLKAAQIGLAENFS